MIHGHLCWIPKATDTHSECVTLIAFFYIDIFALTLFNITFMSKLRVLFIYSTPHSI